MHILDLDNYADWEDQYSQFIKGDDVWPTVRFILSQETDEQFSNLIDALKYDIENTELSELKTLHQKCCDYVETTYSHVAAYHGCRPVDLTSYLDNGVLPANTAAIIERANQLFGDCDAVKRAVEDIGRNYVEFHEGKIGVMFCSRSLQGSNYVTHGSELLHNIAVRISNNAVQQLEGLGTPCIFRCALPMEWLDKFTTFPVKRNYALTPLVHVLSRFRWPEHCESPYQEGGFFLVRSVPKELIQDIVQVQ